MPSQPHKTLHLSREEINLLPLRRYEGPIELIKDQAGLDRVLPQLFDQDLLGFDTETRPAFRKGQQYPPALLQLATAETVFLFQLSLLGLPKSLCQLLGKPGVIKAGVGIAFDLQQLQNLHSFNPQSCIDLALVARKAHIRNQGLRGLAAVLLGFRISKSARTSNWAKAELSPQQMRYAATDAWLGRALYLSLQQRAERLLPKATAHGR
jgi:ribonuclease D